MAAMFCPDRRRCLAALAGVAAGARARAAPAARIEWPDLDWVSGTPVPRSQLRGRPVVVVFWASYCAFCKRHNAHIDELYRASDPLRLQILAIAVDSAAPAVRRYMAANGYRFPVALAACGLRQQWSDRRVVPLTCTVQRDGRPGLCIPGEMSRADVLALGKLALPEAR